MNRHILPILGSANSKANISRKPPDRGMQKKASFKSNTIYQVQLGGSRLSLLYGLGVWNCRVKSGD